MITPEDISKLAELARIKVSDQEKEAFVKEIDAILEYVGQIQKVNSSDSNSFSAIKNTNVMREDVSPHESGIFTDAIIDGAPMKEGNYIKVKKILPSQ